MVAVAAVVIVQIVPAAPAEELGERLIAACTQGLRQGACVLSSERDAAQRSTLAAEVRWQEDFRVATVRVLRQGGAEGDGVSGKIVFDDDDALEDRWTTAGFTIATLVGDLSPSPEQESVLPPAKEPISTPRVRLPLEIDTPLPARRSATLRGAGGIAVGQGMHDHALRTGPWATLAYAPFQLPAALVLRGSLSWASARGVSVRWSSVAMGMEARWPTEPSPAGVVIQADVGFSHVVASDQRTASRTSAAFSSFAGVDVTLAEPVGLVAGARAEVGPITQLATPAGLVEDRRVKLGGSVGILIKL